ncbi:MAG: hypothetical protein II262_06485, partial [Alistipes sp.]|nr:hypothetical protein [Alistipes sp.]
MKRFLTLAVFVFVALCASAQSRAERILAEIRNPKTKYVVVIAHRSDWRHYPENSLAAMEGAIAMGVDMVEIDVQRTADGVLVCCHDGSVDRTTTGKGKVKEITSDYIATLKLKTKQGDVTEYGMPTLAQALDLCRGRVLINIDKGINYYDQILEMLVERDMVEQVVIKSSKKPTTVAKHFAKHSQNMLYMPIINYRAKNWERHSPLFESYLSSDVPTIAYEICWDDQVFIIDEAAVIYDKTTSLTKFPIAVYTPQRPDGNPYGMSKLKKIRNTVIVLNIIDMMEATQPYRLANRPKFINVDGRINVRSFAQFGNTPGATFQVKGDPSNIVKYVDFPTIPDMTNLKNRLENSIFQVTGVDPYYKGRMTNSIQTTGATQAFQARVTMLTDNSRITMLEEFCE